MADNRQFTDHNEIGGVNVYLEDKKLAESPEKNTVASTDYVLLKDTDGVPQKISKANLMGVVKDALGDLLRGNDLGTSVTNVPALNASAFGSATVANLISVLGATATQIISSDNLDDILSPGMYYWNYSRPTGATEDTCFMKVYKCKSDIIIQEIYSYVDMSFIRTRKKDGNTFGDWRSRPYFLNAYSDLSSLATALGVGIITETNNANTAYPSEGGMFAFYANKDRTNTPVDADGYLLSIRWPSGTYVLQFYLDDRADSLTVWNRSYDGTSWSTWHQL